MACVVIILETMIYALQENLKAMCEVGIDFPDLCVGLLLEALPE